MERLLNCENGLFVSRVLFRKRQQGQKLGSISGNIVYVVQQFSQVLSFGFHLFINQDITMGAIIATMILW